MKHHVWIASAGLFMCVLAHETSGATEPQIIEIGPHHRVIQRVVTEPQPDGTMAERVSRFTELSTGLHFKNALGEYVLSQARFRLFPGGAVADEGPFQLIVAPDITDEPTVDLQTPDSKRLQISPRWLAFFDRDTQQSSIIAAVKPCGGQLVEPNVIAFPDAFDSTFAAVRLTYQSWGIESDVIFLAQSDALRPEAAGFDANSPGLVVEMWSEVLLSPEPVSLSTNSLGNGLRDVHVSFGEAHLGAGRAFSLGDEGDSISVAKTWAQVGQRQFLIEAVRFVDVAPLLARLPEQAQANPGAPPDRDVRALAQRRPVAGRAGLLAQGDQRLQAKERRMQTAAIRPASTPWGQGVCIDYTILSGSLTNLTLRSDSTYYVNTNNTINLYGTTVLEGTCVKFGPGTTRLQILGTTECRTDPGRPAFFVSKDDDTVGEVLPNSTGSPGTNRYALAAVHLASSGTSHSLAHLRFRNAVRAVWVTTGTATFTLEHSQFGFTDYPIYSQNPGLSPVRGRNLLVHDGLAAFRGDGNSSNWLEHLTVHRVKTFNAGGSVFLTNSLLISTTNALTFTGSPNITNLDDTGYFQTVGASSHYLISGSTNRNSGTTNTNPDLLSALRKKTTWPPIVLTNHITTDTTLTPQAQRDTDTPDLGAHFEPLDFVASQIAVSNATLTLETGTVLGVYGGSSAPGLVLLDGGKILSTGAPDNLNRILRYNLVQEQATTTWSASSVGRSITTVSPYGTNLLPSEARFRFTDFSMPPNGNDHLYMGATNLTFTVQDCQFHGGGFTAVQPNVTLLNNLFDRVAFKLYANVHPFAALVRNGTFFGGTVTLSNAVSAGWNFTDNLFDTTNIVQVGFVTNNYNGYLTNSARLTNNGANDVLLTLTNIAYEAGWLSRFYLPTNLTSHSVLFNSGSQNATNAGLYHFTAVTNQTRELSTTVDLGFHSVAVNSSGQPLDTGDGDGLPDYFEDANGNGSVDSGETDWQTANDWGLRVFITRPRNGGNIP